MRTLGQLVDDLCFIETWLIVARLVISWFPSIDYGNPLVRALRAVTDPVLRVFRPILPTFAGLDFSPILAIVTLRIVGDAFGNLGVGYSPMHVVIDIIGQVVLSVLIIVVVVVFLQAILGVFHADPWHPATRMIRETSRPLTSPFRSMRFGLRQFDLSAVVALAVYLALFFIVRAIFDSILQNV